MKRTGCQAYQVSDQMSCPSCGLVWDMNDPDPPACRTIQQREVEKMKQVIANEPEEHTIDEFICDHLPAVAASRIKWEIDGERLAHSINGELGHRIQQIVFKTNELTAIVPQRVAMRYWVITADAIVALIQNDS